jgi:hypothetical protein
MRMISAVGVIAVQMVFERHIRDERLGQNAPTVVVIPDVDIKSSLWQHRRLVITSQYLDYLTCGESMALARSSQRYLCR